MVLNFVWRTRSLLATVVAVVLSVSALTGSPAAGSAEPAGRDEPVGPYVAVETMKHGAPQHAVVATRAEPLRAASRKSVGTPLYLSTEETLDSLLRHVYGEAGVLGGGAARLADGSVRIFDGAGRLLELRGGTYVVAARQPSQVRLRRYVIAAFNQRRLGLEARAAALAAFPLPAVPPLAAPIDAPATSTKPEPGPCADVTARALQLTRLEVTVLTPTEDLLRAAHRQFVELHALDYRPCEPPRPELPKCEQPPCLAPHTAGYLHNFWHRIFM